MRKKILIVSDSHGNNTNLRQVIKNMAGSMDLMIHLGDLQCDPEDIRSIAGCPVEMVRGNCDSVASGLPNAKLIQIGDYKVLIAHGHQFGVNCGIETIREAAEENGAQIAMFGHTHKPFLERGASVTVLNPGSVTQPRQEGRQPTYMVMNIEEDGRVDFVLCHL